LFVSVVVLFSACSKSGNSGNNNGGGNNGGGNNPTPPPNYLLHTSYTVQRNSSGAVTNSEGNIYAYDKTNNTATIYRADTINGLPYPDTLLFTLTGDVVSLTYKKAHITSTTYLHSGHNYPDSMVLVNSPITNRTKYEYTFDGNGKLATRKLTETIYTNGTQGSAEVSTNVYTWVNGNMVSDNLTDNSFTYSATFDANALAAAPDPIMNLISPLNPVLTNKNIIKTSVSTFSGSVQNLVFTYDDKGRVINEAYSDNHGTTSAIINTYY